jgi:hypothetical protein
MEVQSLKSPHERGTGKAVRARPGTGGPDAQSESPAGGLRTLRRAQSHVAFFVELAPPCPVIFVRSEQSNVACTHDHNSHRLAVGAPRTPSRRLGHRHRGTPRARCARRRTGPAGRATHTPATPCRTHIDCIRYITLQSCSDSYRPVGSALAAACTLLFGHWPTLHSAHGHRLIDKSRKKAMGYAKRRVTRV